MSAPLRVSVVIPSLDQGRFLPAAIDSVLAQDHRPLELVVRDGGSRDGTLDVLRGYGDRVRWVSAPDAGQSAAINAGWLSTRGDVVAWLNADDTYEPGAVAAAARALGADPGLDVVYGQAWYVDEHGRALRRYPSEDFDFARLLGRAVCFIPQPATFLRRRVLERAGWLDESLHYALDLEYWLRLGAAGLRFRHLPQPLARMRLHAAAKSARALSAFAPEIVHVYQRLVWEGVPGASADLTRRALGSAHYRAAQCLFWDGQVERARSHARRAWRLDPLRPRLLAAALLARAVTHRFLTRWRGNPFRTGIAPT